MYMSCVLKKCFANKRCFEFLYYKCTGTAVIYNIWDLSMNIWKDRNYYQVKIWVLEESTIIREQITVAQGKVFIKLNVRREYRGEKIKILRRTQFILRVIKCKYESSCKQWSIRCILRSRPYSYDFNECTSL